MMTNSLINFELISSDGKYLNKQIESVYVRVPTYGVMGFLSGSAPLVGALDISNFYIVFKGKKEYFAMSGGMLDVRKDKIIILADTFESREELDKERILEAKKRAEQKLAKLSKEDALDYEMAEFSLKKAINRLNLIK